MYTHNSTLLPVELFGRCHIPCLQSVELCPAHFLCVCVCSCVYLLIIIPASYSKDLLLSPDKVFGIVTDKEYDEEFPRYQTSLQSQCSALTEKCAFCISENLKKTGKCLFSQFSLFILLTNNIHIYLFNGFLMSREAIH